MARSVLKNRQCDYNMPFAFRLTLGWLKLATGPRSQDGRILVPNMNATPQPTFVVGSEPVCKTDLRCVLAFIKFHKYYTPQVKTSPMKATGPNLTISRDMVFSTQRKTSSSRLRPSASSQCCHTSTSPYS